MLNKVQRELPDDLMQTMAYQPIETVENAHPEIQR